jgi:hypothetical protein
VRGHRSRAGRRGFLIIYALGVMALVAAVAAVMFNAGQSEIEVSRRRMYLQLARSAADAGVEHGLGLINHELGELNGPYSNPTYEPSTAWMKAETLLKQGTTDSTKLETAYRVTPLMVADEGTTGSVRYNVQYQLTMWPVLSYASTRLATDTLFFRRSRGETIMDYNSDGVGDEVAASATVIQTFRVTRLSTGCGLPAATRLLWELEPSSLGLIPANPH